MLRTMLVLWGIVLLIAIALTVIGGCGVTDDDTGHDFAQVRIYNATDSGVAVDTDRQGWRLSPGDSIDAVFTTGGLHRVTVIGDDTVDAYYDVTDKRARHFLRIR